jgi:hypothetical protein
MVAIQLRKWTEEPSAPVQHLRPARDQRPLRMYGSDIWKISTDSPRRSTFDAIMLVLSELVSQVPWLLVISSQRTGSSKSMRKVSCDASTYSLLSCTDTITSRWTHRPASVLVYMAKCPGACDSFDGAGKVWCKLYPCIASRIPD